MIEKVNMKDKILLDYDACSKLCIFNILVCSLRQNILWIFRGFVVLNCTRLTESKEFLMFGH